MFSRQQQQQQINHNLGSTNNKQVVEEEKEVLECLSFRNFAGDSCVDRLSSPYSDGDLEFEFFPVVIQDSSALSQVSFYPVFGVDEFQRQPKMKDNFADQFEAKITFLPKIYMGTKRRSKMDKCKSSSTAAATVKSVSRWKRLIELLVGKKTSSHRNKRVYITRNKSTSSPNPNNTVKKIPKDDRKHLTYLPYRSNLMALFPSRQ